MPPTKQELTASSDDDKVLGPLIDERAQRLATYIFVFGLLWGAVGTFIFWKRGIEIAAYPFGVMSTIFFLSLVEKKSWLKRNTTINLFLITNYLGLLACVWFHVWARINIV